MKYAEYHIFALGQLDRNTICNNIEKEMFNWHSWLIDWLCPSKMAFPVSSDRGVETFETVKAGAQTVAVRI